MRPTLTLLRKNLLMFWRSRAGVVITFLVPIILIYLFGHVFGLYRRETGPSGISIGVVNLSAEPAAQRLVEALQAERSFQVITTTRASDNSIHPLTEAEARAALHDNDYRYALTLPADLIRENGFGLRLVFLTNPRNEIEAQTVNGLLQKTIFTHVPELLGQSLQQSARRTIGAGRLEAFNRGLARNIAQNFGGDEAALERRIGAGELFPSGSGNSGETDSTADDGDSSADFLGRLIAIETEQVAGRDVKNPMAARVVGGYAIMFLLFAVSASASAFFEEKNSGVFQRLLASPVRPAHILWARFLFGMILGLAQILVLFVAGDLLYGLELWSHLGGLLAVALASAAACSAFGLFVTALAPNEAAANPISTLLVLTMSAIGGAWFPVSFMPETIQSAAKFTLVYWSVEGFTDVLWAGRSLLEILPKAGVLLAMAALVMTFSVWRFQRSKFFT